MKKQLLAPFMLLVAPIISNAQIIWNTIEDTLALTPVLFETPGTIKFKDGKFAAGQVTFDPRNKDIYFNDSINSFLFERGQVESVVTNYYGGMTLADAFAGDAYDRFLKQYRTINYDDFNLNKIVYSLAKGSSYTVGPKGNVMIRNEQKLDGKICAVGTSGIKILNSNGDILTLKARDFNYIEFDGKRFLSCASLYSYFFRNYQIELLKFKKNWTNTIISIGIDGFMKSNGPISKIFDVSSTRRLFIWEERNNVLHLDISTGAITSGFSFRNSFSTSSESGSRVDLPIFNSIMFLRRDIYEYGSANTFGSSVSKTYQSGLIQSKDETVSIAFLIDGSNTILDVYTRNVFYTPRYGRDFIFF